MVSPQSSHENQTMLLSKEDENSMNPCLSMSGVYCRLGNLLPEESRRYVIMDRHCGLTFICAVVGTLLTLKNCQ
jgi:hypothetical protein